MHNYRVTFRQADNQGIADFVCDVRAESGRRALEQGQWLLAAVHADDHAAYVFERMERIDRRVRIDPPDDWSVTA